MNKDLRYNELFDVYGKLLTDKQREIFSSYFDYDLSLSEIAESQGTTRQNVYDAVKKVKEKLDEYEKILRLASKNSQITEIAEEVGKTDKGLAGRIMELKA